MTRFNIVRWLTTILLLTPISQAQNILNSTKHRRALVIGLDGTTGNQFHHRVWKQNKAPHFRELMLSGEYTVCENDRDERCAKTHSGHHTGSDYYWLTGPGWASVITGADNTHHGVKDNHDDSLKIFSKSSHIYPSFFKRSKDIGLKTAAAGVGAFLTSHKKNKLSYGIVDYECGFQKRGPAVSADATQSCNLDSRKSFSSTDKDRDHKLTSWLLDHINDSSFALTMGVYDMIDSAGHSFGFDSNSNYLQAISNTDTQVGKLLNLIKSRVDTKNEEWLILLTSDHGGHRLLSWGSHGSVISEDEVIPFVVAVFGSDIKLSNLKYPVSHLDVHPTLMQWFGMASPKAAGRVQGF